MSQFALGARFPSRRGGNAPDRAGEAGNRVDQVRLDSSQPRAGLLWSREVIEDLQDRLAHRPTTGPGRRLQFVVLLPGESCDDQDLGDQRRGEAAWQLEAKAAAAAEAEAKAAEKAKEEAELEKKQAAVEAAHEQAK